MPKESHAEHRVHAFGNDALGHHDAVALAGLIRRGELSAQEVLAAAVARVARLDALGAIATDLTAAPRTSLETDTSSAPFAGVPAFVKDVIDLAGSPSRFGSEAMPTRAADKDEAVTKQLLAEGLVVLGKTCTPEFGFSPTTEFERMPPTRNPWNTAFSAGGSSGGSAALVAAGAVPIAHGNDGGGSIRIPASNTGLFGLKPTRGRWHFGKSAGRLPLRIVSEGILTRSVRDTAHFYAAVEQRRAPRGLPPIGLVEGPSGKRLRIGLVLDSIRGVTSCPETRAAVERMAKVLQRLGHEVFPLVPPVPDFFLDDFKLYWGFIAWTIRRGGKLFVTKDLDTSKLDGLTCGLSAHFERRAYALPLALTRLGGSKVLYRRAFQQMDMVLSPVTTHTAPRLGHLSPAVPFDELFERISRYTAFTPLNNATGAPGMSVPAGFSSDGLPIGAHFSANLGAERTLLELAYELEGELGFPKIDEATP
jgi:amidase